MVEVSSVKTNNRNVTIDILKGIGIVLMVLGHMHFDDQYFGRIVYAFHMPLFFLVSGFLYKKPNNLFNYLKRKAKRILVPYAVFATAYLFLSFCLSRKVSTLFDGLKSILVFPTQGMPMESALWFLPAMFLCYVIYALLDKFVKSRVRFTAIISVLTCTGCFYSSVTDIRLPFAVGPAMASLGFYGLGQLWKCKQTEIGLQKKGYFVVIVGMFSFCLAWLLEPLNVRLEKWGGVQFILHYLCAVGIVFFLFAVIDCFVNRFEFDGCKDYGLTFIGQNSIVYLCINHPCLMVAERILRLIGLPNEILLYVGMFVISMTGMHIASLVLTRTKLRMILGLK